MRKNIFIALIFVPALFICGCVATSSGLLKPAVSSLQVRQVEIKQYDTKDELRVLSATAAVLQDMGFTLTEVEKKLGLIVASKERDATVPGQIAMAAFIDILGATGGSSSNAMQTVDAVQTILVSCVTKRNLEGNKVAVRVTFQRVVFNRMNQVSRLETIKDPDIYEGFFDKLSKSIFLEADKI
ncbi:MAG: hypothetical protein BWY16_01038 [Candidatus Omnitrophica bacterium ADurb.Bin205]|nr:MAG: hypothetical protein BWY16_01038 [Candidatus Omnitrophica bacterium ADurb.Bin205]